MSGKKSEDDIKTAAEAAEDAVLPEAGFVSAGGTGPSAEGRPLPPEMAQKPVAQKSPAEWAYERIILYIQNFEENLDSEEEMVMGYVGSEAGNMRVEGMGFFAPDLVSFYGRDENGLKTQMVQHVSQLTVMLRAMPKPDAEREAVRIGFKLGEGLKTSAKNTA